MKNTQTTTIIVQSVLNEDDTLKSDVLIDKVKYLFVKLIAWWHGRLKEKIKIKRVLLLKGVWWGKILLVVFNYDFL